MENKEKKEPVEEMPAEEIAEEKPDEPFIDRERKEQMSIKNLWVGTIKDIISKAVYVFLTETQKDDLTDGGATTLHKHDHGEMDGLDDNDHGAIYYTETELDTKLGLKANDNAVVKLSGNQSVAGIKTHSSFPVTPSSAPTTNYQTANKKYVDDNAGATYTVGDNLLASADTERTKADDATYTKIKEIVINRSGALRLKLESCHINGRPGYTRVYRNGVAVGDENASVSNFPGWGVISEDVSGWSAGDLVQIYYKGYYDEANSQIYIRNFRIYVSEAIVVKQN